MNEHVYKAPFYFLWGFSLSIVELRFNTFLSVKFSFKTGQSWRQEHDPNTVEPKETDPRTLRPSSHYINGVPHHTCWYVKTRCFEFTKPVSQQIWAVLITTVHSGTSVTSQHAYRRWDSTSYMQEETDKFSSNPVTWPNMLQLTPQTGKFVKYMKPIWKARIWHTIDTFHIDETKLSRNVCKKLHRTTKPD